MDFNNFRNLIFAAILVCVFLGFNEVIHEQAHQRIYDKFGVNSTIEYGWTFAQTIPNAKQYGELSDSDRRTVEALQLANEFTGYQIQSLVLPLFISIFVNMVLVRKFIEKGVTK